MVLEVRSVGCKMFRSMIPVKELNNAAPSATQNSVRKSSLRKKDNPLDDSLYGSESNDCCGGSLTNSPSIQGTNWNGKKFKFLLCSASTVSGMHVSDSQHEVLKSCPCNP